MRFETDMCGERVWSRLTLLRYFGGIGNVRAAPAVDRWAPPDWDRNERENRTCLSFGFSRGVRSDENREVVFIFARGFVFAFQLNSVVVSIRVRQHYTSRHVIKLPYPKEIARQRRQVQKSSRNNVVERRQGRTRSLWLRKLNSRGRHRCISYARVRYVVLRVIFRTDKYKCFVSVVRASAIIAEVLPMCLGFFQHNDATRFDTQSRCFSR